MPTSNVDLPLRDFVHSFLAVPTNTPLSGDDGPSTLPEEAYNNHPIMKSCIPDFDDEDLDVLLAEAHDNHMLPNEVCGALSRRSFPYIKPEQ